jgi:hypothetical protein
MALNFKGTLIAYLDAKSSAERRKLEPTLKRLGEWSTLPPMSILKKMAELYKPQPPLPTPIKLYHRTTATAAKAIWAKRVSRRRGNVRHDAAVPRRLAIE